MTKIGAVRHALVRVEEVMHAAFTDQEEAFFREGDEMSRYAGDSVPTPVIDLPSYRRPAPRGFERVVELTDDYASYSVTIEADEMSGLCEAAA